MQRLRVLSARAGRNPLSVLLAAVLAASVSSAAAQTKKEPAKAPAGKAEAKTDEKAEEKKPPKLKVGDVLESSTPLKRVGAAGDPVNVSQRNGKGLVLVFWSTGSTIARKELQKLDDFLADELRGEQIEAPSEQEKEQLRALGYGE